MIQTVVFPSLMRKAGRIFLFVFKKSVSVKVSILFTPFKRGNNMRPISREPFSVHGFFVIQTAKVYEKRCYVHRTIVRKRPGKGFILRGVRVPLMNNLTGFLFAHTVNFFSLKPGENFNSAASDIRVVVNQLP